MNFFGRVGYTTMLLARVTAGVMKEENFLSMALAVFSFPT